MRFFLRSQRLPWLLLGLAGALILASSPAQYLGRQHDDVLFVVASHALKGGSYSLFLTPDNPPLVHVWPGLPALLLPVTWLAGEVPAAYQLFMALLLAACPFALWFWLKGREDGPQTLLIPLLFATSPLVLSQAGCVMPEVPYLLLATSLLIVLERAKRDARSVGALLLSAILTRSAGLSLLPGAVWPALREKRWRDAFRTLAPAAAGVLMWLGWCREQAGYVQEGREWAESYEGRGPMALLSLPAANAKFFADSLGSSFLPAALEGSALAFGLGTALLAAAGRTLLREFKAKKPSPVGLMVTAAAGMHLFWGWQYERYWIPLLPFVLWAMSAALGRQGAWVLGGLLLLQLGFRTPAHLKASPHAMPELRETYEWLKQRMSPAEALASPLYARDSYYIGRLGVPLAKASSAEELASLLRSRRVRFVIWQDLELGLTNDGTSALRGRLQDVRRQLGDTARFRLVREDPAGAQVFELAR